MTPAGRTVARIAAALSRLPWWVEDILAAVSLFVALAGVGFLSWGLA